MKKKLAPIAFAALLLCLSMSSVNSAPVPFDNTFQFTGTFGLLNPCNNEIVQGPIDIQIVVSTAETGNGQTKVNVHHHSHGMLSGNQGNEYQISRRSKGQFDAVSTQYVIPWFGEFIGNGAAPNFTAEGTLRVFTNANNEPIGSQLVTISTECK